MAGAGARSPVTTRAARPDDLAAVLALVRQHRSEAHAEGVLTGQTPGAAAAPGFRRLLADAEHRVVLAVLPGADVARGSGTGESVVGLAILGVDPLSVVLGVAQVTVDNLVVHRDHRRCGAGAALLGAAVRYAEEVGADHVVGSVGGHEAERQRFFSRMGFAPLTTRRIVPRETLARALAAWQRGGVLVPPPRRPVLRRRPVSRVQPVLGAAAEA
ncbi:GNAT family N-acetyltransferase [Geodermatophilus marinus]|uniref:GNAT family N-acetyltransferase n=1 Tax=Geodermatophilus sp. LHW52908 TaxID=2303986 RepID=UPI0013142408|nr:GNAT family N-acetyltransferase [Geodermatophilus sp. LHW52908]